MVFRLGFDPLHPLVHTDKHVAHVPSQICFRYGLYYILTVGYESGQRSTQIWNMNGIIIRLARFGKGLFPFRLVHIFQPLLREFCSFLTLSNTQEGGWCSKFESFDGSSISPPIRKVSQLIQHPQNTNQFPDAESGLRSSGGFKLVGIYPTLKALKLGTFLEDFYQGSFFPSSLLNVAWFALS